jgi:hypothetical protein
MGQDTECYNTALERAVGTTPPETKGEIESETQEIKERVAFFEYRF